MEELVAEVERELPADVGRERECVACPGRPKRLEAASDDNEECCFMCCTPCKLCSSNLGPGPVADLGREVSSGAGAVLLLERKRHPAASWSRPRAALDAKLVRILGVLSRECAGVERGELAAWLEHG